MSRPPRRPLSPRCEALETRVVPAFLTPITSAVDFGQTGDFNGDGKADLIRLEVATQSVVVHLGKGDGTFQSGRMTPTGASPLLRTVADLNHDGKADLVVQQSTKNGSEQRIFLGNGNGTFAVGGKLPTLPKLADGSTQFTQQITAADLNLDGKLDLVVVGGQTKVTRNLHISGGYLNVFLGNGSGVFTAPKAAVLLGSEPGSLTFPAQVADFNGDGRPDVAAFTGRYSHVLMSQPDGSFVRKQSPAAAPSGPSATGDFNGDGKADLVRASTGGNTVAVSLSVGDGTFGSPQTISAATGVGTVAMADLNGDGKPDLVTTNSQTTGADSVSVLLGNGDGTFRTARTFAVGAELISIALADFDGDGRIDLARREWDGTAYRTSVLLNDGSW
ncbi:MAG: VCBS repeat-containing protein [Isosphaeraceae bacterium]